MNCIRLTFIAALLAAASSAPAAAQDFAYLSASLLGDNVPGGGDDDASADFNGEADLEAGELCYFFDIAGLRNATGSHIHRADAAEGEPEVVAIELPAEEGDEVCITMDPAVLAQLAEEPRSYYVDIHSAAHPEGAVRGQLRD